MARGRSTSGVRVFVAVYPGARDGGDCSAGPVLVVRRASGAVGDAVRRAAGRDRDLDSLVDQVASLAGSSGSGNYRQLRSPAVDDKWVISSESSPPGWVNERAARGAMPAVIAIPRTAGGLCSSCARVGRRSVATRLRRAVSAMPNKLSSHEATLPIGASVELSETTTAAPLSVDALLEQAVGMGASDLHLTVGSSLPCAVAATSSCCASSPCSTPT